MENLVYILKTSMKELAELTAALVQVELDEYGVPVALVYSVDAKLAEATKLIKDAQTELSLARERESIRKTSDDLRAKEGIAKDEMITQLKQELRDAQSPD